MTSLTDEYRFNELFSFIEQESPLDLQRIEAEIPPELDQHLQDLGYVR